MEQTAAELYDTKLKQIIENIPTDLESNESTTAMKNFETFVKSKPVLDEPEPTPAPTTRWGKVKAVVGPILDNETTRSVVKAGGALAGVVVVTYATIQRDHVYDRTALNQANQAPR